MPEALDGILSEQEWEEVEDTHNITRVSPPYQGGTDSAYRPNRHASAIDLDDIVYISCDRVPSQYYHALNRDGLTQAITGWEKRFQYSSAADEVVRRVLTWKRNGSYTREAYEHECLVKDTWGLEGEPRGKEKYDSESGFDIDEKEREFIEQLREISKSYLDRHYSENIDVYRGCNHHLGEIAHKLFKRPEKVSVNISPNVLVNFTISKQIAETYSPVLIERPIQPREVGLATDHLLWYTPIQFDKKKSSSKHSANRNAAKDRGVRYADGEIQVFGEEMQSLNRTSIRFVGVSTSLPRLFERIPCGNIAGKVPEVAEECEFKPEEHRAIAICVRKLRKTKEELPSGKPRQRLSNWFAILSFDDPDTPFDGIVDEAEITIASLKELVEDLTGIPAQTTSGKVKERLENA